MDPRSLTRDFSEFLQCLNAHAVEYLVVGGHAVAYHGYPRATSDLDVWVAVNPTNAYRLATALRQFGFDVPMQALALWLRGLAAEGEVEEARVDARGRPLELHQFGWVIRFPDWHSMSPADLPRRVFAERVVPGGKDRVRVIVDRWQGDDGRH